MNVPVTGPLNVPVNVPVNGPVNGPVTPGSRQVWRAARAPLTLLVLVVAAALSIALATAGGSREDLDPTSTAPRGTRALAALLEQQGVTVTRTTSLSTAGQAGAGVTLLVAQPDLLDPRQLARLRAAATLVLLDPGPTVLGALAPGVAQVGSAPAGSLADPGCPLSTAQRAGPAGMGGQLYRIGSLPPCYPHGSGGSLVVLTIGSQRVVVMGDATAMTNAHLAEQGNAALSMGLLGQNERLVWLMPSPAVGAVGKRSLVSLIPQGVRLAMLQLGVAAVVLALWRARRLGPVVTEELPVWVPASETVLGRGRLYRRTRARGPASAALRAETGHRLAARLGLPAGAGADELVSTLVAHTARPREEIFAMLYGGVPTDDTALVALAGALADLEKEVSRT